MLFTNSNRAWLWPIVLAALIFFASGRSEVAGPDVQHIDKLTHFAVYGLLGTLVVRLRSGRRWSWTALALVSLYGLTDEWHQSFTPGRIVELGDWVADTVGAAVAIALYTRCARYRALLEMPLRRKRRIENPGAVAAVSAQ